MNGLTSLTGGRAAWLWFAAAGIACLALAAGLAWVSNQFHSLSGWLSFLSVALVAAALLFTGWRLVQKFEQPAQVPGWLAAALITAFILRLGLGVLWFTLLPVLGHPNPVEQSGYVMSDAHRRDQAAWALAQSEQPLVQAFSADPAVDQYGGLLFISSLVYRYLGGVQHQPLLIVLLSAAFSALSVLLLWAFARQVWNPAAAALGAWGLVFYPEAALLGSSQMREAFSISLVMADFYGLALCLRKKILPGLVWIAAAFALLQPISPPLTVFLFILMTLAILLLPASTAYLRSRRAWWVGPALGGLLVLVLGSLWLGARQYSPPELTHPVDQVLYWIRLAVDDQKQNTETSSDIIGALFKNTPAWTHFPLLVTYGALQPFLPAALLTTSQSPIWQPVAIWRSLGWAGLLPLLLYVPFRAFWAGKKQRLTLALGIGIWLLIFVAAFRAGGDQWDNPRYRAAFAALQVGVAAWAVTQQRPQFDPWLRRMFLMILAFLAPFIPWYLARRFGASWPAEELQLTIGLGLGLGVITLAVDWILTQRRPKRI